MWLVKRCKWHQTPTNRQVLARARNKKRWSNQVHTHTPTICLAAFLERSMMSTSALAKWRPSGMRDRRQSITSFSSRWRSNKFNPMHIDCMRYLMRATFRTVATVVCCISRSNCLSGAEICVGFYDRLTLDEDAAHTTNADLRAGESLRKSCKINKIIMMAPIYKSFTISIMARTAIMCCSSAKCGNALDGDKSKWLRRCDT